MTPNSDDGWDEWRRHVLAESERQGEAVKDLWGEVVALRKEMAGEMIQIHSGIAALQVKAGIWGGVAGALVAISVLLIGLLSN